MNDNVSKNFDVEAEMRDLAARRDIFALLCNYMRGQDRLLPELHRSVFADDSYIDCGSYKGDATGFVDFAQGFLAQLSSSHHLIGQADITVNGDHASGEIYFTAQHRMVEAGAEKDLFVAGRYVDEYGRRDGEWKILKRCELVDWARTDPATDDFLRSEGGSSLNIGGRASVDFSSTRAWPKN